MANPYKKDAERKKVAPGGTAKPHEKVEPIVEVKEEPATQENPLKGMIEPKQNGKPCGFYLSVEAIKKLDELAKQNRCSKSKALDALLRSLS